MSGNTIFVNPGQNFQMQLWFKPNQNMDMNGIYAAIGFGRAANATANTDSFGKIHWIGGTTELPGLTDMTFGAPRPLDDPLAGSNNPFGSDIGAGAVRPWGVYGYSLMTPPTVCTVTGNQDILIATLTFGNTLSAMTGFGDDEAGGLIVYTSTGESDVAPTLFSSGWTGSNVGVSTQRHNGTTGSRRYIITAVPEPGSIVAIAAGLALLSTRRRKAR